MPRSIAEKTESTDLNLPTIQPYVIDTMPIDTATKGTAQAEKLLGISVPRALNSTACGTNARKTTTTIIAKISHKATNNAIRSYPVAYL